MTKNELKLFGYLKRLEPVFGILDGPDKRRIITISLARIFANSLDLIGLLLISVLASISVQTEHSYTSNVVVSNALDFFGVNELSRQSALIATASAAAAFFVCKSYLALRLLRSTVHIVANAETRVAERITHSWLNSPNSKIESFSITTTTYALLQSLNSLVSSQLNAIITLISEASFLILILLALIIYNPLMTLGVLSYFLIVGIIIQKKTFKNIDYHSRNVTKGWLNSASIIQDTMNVFKEISILGIRRNFVLKFINARRQVATSSAEAEYLIGTPRYYVESALYIGVLLLCLPVVGSSDPSAAIQNVAVFLVAATRMIPSILPLQQSVTNLRMAQVRGEPATHFMNHFEEIFHDEIGRQSQTDMTNEVELREVNACHPNGKPVISNVGVSIATGEYIALVGPSGAGKTSLLEICLGLRPHSKGLVKIRGTSPILTLESGIQKTAYVPQAISLINGSIRDNISLFNNSESDTDERIWKILDELELKSRVQEMEKGLDSILGSEGESLSGGEKQRIGIARALFAKPDILFLDEATSALDPTTELIIQKVLSDRSRFPTVIAVAHRLGTVRDASRIIYLKQGAIVETGTYQELLNGNSDFSIQMQNLLEGG